MSKMWFKTDWFISVSSAWVLGVSLAAPFPLLLSDFQGTPADDTYVAAATDIDILEEKQPSSSASNECVSSKTPATIAHLANESINVGITSLLPVPQPLIEAANTDTPDEKATEDRTIQKIETPPVEIQQGISIPVRMDMVGDSLLAPPLIGNQLALEGRGALASESKTAQVQIIDQENVPPKTEPIVGTANRISVPSIEIDIAVQPGSYDPATSEWTVDESTAFHADITVPVNDSNGTTLIYGHARWGLFGNLPDIDEGAEATVYTSEGKQFLYKFESVREVSPSDVSMLTAEGAPKLVMQTCSGLFNQHRIIATFLLKEVV